MKGMKTGGWRLLAAVSLLLALVVPAFAEDTLSPWFGPGGGDNGPALDASAAGCSRMDGRAGVVYVACPQQDAVRRILSNGRVERFAGTYTRPTSNTVPPVGTLALDWPLFAPGDVAADSKGRVFILAAPFIYRVTAGGGITAFAPVSSAGAIAAGRDLLYVTRPSGAALDVYDTDCAGPGCPPVQTITGFSGLLELRDVVVSPDDSAVTILTRTDVRRLMPDGTHFRIALGGSTTPTGPTPALEARLGAPSIMALAPDGALYVADTGGNPRVYRISGTTIAPFAGSGVVFTEYAGALPAPGTRCASWPMRANGIVATSSEVFIGTNDGRGFRCSSDGVVLPTPTSTAAAATATPLSSATAAATATRTRTATAPPTFTPTSTPPPTSTATLLPTVCTEVCTDPNQTM